MEQPPIYDPDKAVIRFIYEPADRCSNCKQLGKNLIKEVAYIGPNLTSIHPNGEDAHELFWEDVHLVHYIHKDRCPNYSSPEVYLGTGIFNEEGYYRVFDITHVQEKDVWAATEYAAGLPIEDARLKVSVMDRFVRFVYPNIPWDQAAALHFIINANFIWFDELSNGDELELSWFLSGIQNLTDGCGIKSMVHLKKVLATLIKFGFIYSEAEYEFSIKEKSIISKNRVREFVKFTVDINKINDWLIQNKKGIFAVIA